MLDYREHAFGAKVTAVGCSKGTLRVADVTAAAALLGLLYSVEDKRAQSTCSFSAE